MTGKALDELSSVMRLFVFLIEQPPDRSDIKAAKRRDIGAEATQVRAGGQAGGRSSQSTKHMQMAIVCQCMPRKGDLT